MLFLLCESAAALDTANAAKKVAINTKTMSFNFMFIFSSSRSA